MTRDREIPDPWTESKSSKSSQLNGRQPTRSIFGRKRPFVRSTSGVPDEKLSHKGSRHLPVPPEGLSVSQSLPTTDVPPSESSKKRRLLRQRFSFSLRFWAILIVLISSGVGLTAVALLLKLPTVPNCPATFWPTASASMRLYCAQLAANKQTAENLLQAIALVEELPADHPLRPEINRHIEQWSSDILIIGDQKFQAGQLDEAIKIAKRIPAGVSAQKLVEKRIEHWQTIWSQGQAIYDKADALLRQSKWTQAFQEAVKLTSVDNKYWATTKYEQLSKLVQLAKEASAQLDKAYELSRSDNVDDILAAIKQAQKISSQSYAYTEAQKLIADSGKKLLKIAEYRLDQRNGQGVIEIAEKIPSNLKLQAEKADLLNLGRALSKAASGTISALEEAIAFAQKVGTGRPLFAKGQQLVSRWQREVQDITQLEQARTFASSGLPADIKTAIAQAQQIASGNPRYSEARDEISRWTRQVETMEDQPYLDRATQIANFGGPASLQEAIQEARRIAPGRALYKQAQDKIAQWTDTIQRQQDQPFLDQARALANAGNLPAAITAAQQIRSGRALSGEAQSDIESWQAEIRGQQRLQEAYQTAAPATADALSAAIRVARQVPSSSKSVADARTMINRWSDQLLAIAQDRSSYNIREAIAIASMIPSSASAYDAAQQQIQSWQKILEPPPVILPQPSPTGT